MSKTAREVATGSCIAAIVAMAALVQPVPAFAFLARPALFTGIAAAVPAPDGWLQLCADGSADCRPETDTPRRIAATADLLDTFDADDHSADDPGRWTGETRPFATADP